MRGFFAITLVGLLMNPILSSLAASLVSPYAGEKSRKIKSLSDSDIDDLLNGRGWGLAKAAELNGYPGPRHVLDLAAELDLTADQHAASTALFEAMRSNAMELGDQLIEAESALDRLFSSGEADSTSVMDALARIAVFRARLRHVHLEAHLRQKEILSERQVARYASLRGYHEGHGEHH